MKITLHQVALNLLKPHPRNYWLYGDEDVTSLAQLIHDSGWVRPLVVTPKQIIISGHRRWKAVYLLGWETVAVEYREFPDELAELEALLLENDSRFKTIEQKVREGLVWKEVEASNAKRRQLTTQNNNAGRAVVENFPQLLQEKGKTRDRIAARVGLGSGRTYSKAAKVVERIDALALEGNHEKAKALRQVLNERSVDAAHQLLKHISASNDYSAASLDKDSFNTSNFRENAVVECQRSCWNCQHRGELIENHSFYCYRLGVLSLIEKTADTRADECALWCDKYGNPTDALNSRHQTPKTFSLELPPHLQPILQDAARTAGMSLIDWATWVLESAANNTCNSSVAQQTDKTEHQVPQCRGP